MKEKIIKAFMKMMIPVLELIGRVHLPFVSKEKIFSRYYEIERSLSPGDVILSTSYGHLSNMINPSKWKHALMYVGTDSGVPYIIEAVGEGVVKKHLAEWLSSKDEICILRPYERVLPKVLIQNAVSWMKAQLGKPYDYQFDASGSESMKNFYCSELVYYAIKNAYPSSPLEMRDTWGIKTVKPQDFYDAENKFMRIFEITKGKQK